MRGYLRGHLCEWDGERWRYLDTGEPAEGNPRPCPHCGSLPTPEGHDACLGAIPGAAGACCGHGVHLGYVNWPQMPTRGWWRRAYLVSVGTEEGTEEGER